MLQWRWLVLLNRTDFVRTGTIALVAVPILAALLPVLNDYLTRNSLQTVALGTDVYVAYGSAFLLALSRIFMSLAAPEEVLRFPSWERFLGHRTSLAKSINEAAIVVQRAEKAALDLVMEKAGLPTNHEHTNALRLAIGELVEIPGIKDAQRALGAPEADWLRLNVRTNTMWKWICALLLGTGLALAAYLFVYVAPFKVIQSVL